VAFVALLSAQEAVRFGTILTAERAQLQRSQWNARLSSAVIPNADPEGPRRGAPSGGNIFAEADPSSASGFLGMTRVWERSRTPRLCASALTGKAVGSASPAGGWLCASLLRLCVSPLASAGGFGAVGLREAPALCSPASCLSTAGELPSQGSGLGTSPGAIG